MGDEPNLNEEWGESDLPSRQIEYSRAYHGDRVFYRVVASTLSLVALGALIASFFLAWAPGENEIPQSIVALGSTAVGALAGVLITGKG
ncbi:MAG: hypothetical protein OXD44_00195 [Gammaproteobacteria bacterium]|nr:hypothetical protein [Gammaproteobacteria bacterium]MCY4312121.1 hypothetical protein [Gammaproteobacteria bacterium]